MCIRDSFNTDAIVIKKFKSENIALKSLNHDKSIVFHMNGFDHVGLWAAKHVGGLIAIEPWVGHADYTDFNGEFKEKESCVELPAVSYTHLDVYKRQQLVFLLSMMGLQNLVQLKLKMVK